LSCRSISIRCVARDGDSTVGGVDGGGRRLRERLKTKKKGPGDKPGPKALGNGGVSSREDTRIVPH